MGDKKHYASGDLVEGDKYEHHHHGVPYIIPRILTKQVGLDSDINFIGRKEELEKVDELLNQDSALLLLNGIGGIGKSTLASYGNGEFDKGFVHEVLYPNGHRSTTRGADEGGEQEYASAKKYQDYGKKIKFIYPRTASILQKISNWYLDEAKREDIRNEL